MSMPRPSVLATTLALTAALIGCEVPPSGPSGGRRDPTSTLPGERADARVLPVSLLEFSDSAGRKLAQDLVDIDTIAKAPDRVTIVLGDINNQTQIVSSEEFDLVRRRMRARLLDSQLMKRKVRWVENRARMAAIAEREGVGAPDNPAGPPAYDPKTTFVLNGNYHRINRGNVNYYFMTMELVNFATNELVWNKAYEIKQEQ